MYLLSAPMLREAMEAKGLNASQLATRAGCSRSMISHLLKGGKTSCSPALAVSIADELGVALELLFTNRYGVKVAAS